MAAEKVALVTAGGSGMGAGAARRLAADGFRVARRADALGLRQAIQCDATSRASAGRIL